MNFSLTADSGLTKDQQQRLANDNAAEWLAEVLAESPEIDTVVTKTGSLSFEAGLTIVATDGAAYQVVVRDRYGRAIDGNGRPNHRYQ